MRFFKITGPFFLVLLALVLTVPTSCETDEQDQATKTSEANTGEANATERTIEPAHSARFTFNFPDAPPMEMGHVWDGELSLGDALASQETVEIQMKEYTGMGRLVTGIGKFANGDEEERYWQFCVNGYFSTQGIDDVMLASGDQVAWYFKAYGDDLPCKKAGE
jgi:hypothetical protein